MLPCYEMNEKSNLNGVLGALRDIPHSLLSIFNVNAQTVRGVFDVDAQVETFITLANLASIKPHIQGLPFISGSRLSVHQMREQ